jgi:hypothetical protein
MDRLREAAQRPARRPREFSARNRTVRLGAVMLTWSLLTAAQSSDCRRTPLTRRPLSISSAVWIADRQQIAAVDTLRNQVLLVSTSGKVEVFPSPAQSLPAEIIEIPKGFLLKRLAGPPQVLDRTFRPAQKVSSPESFRPAKPLPASFGSTARLEDVSKPLDLLWPPRPTCSGIDTSQVLATGPIGSSWTPSHGSMKQHPERPPGL